MEMFSEGNIEWCVFNLTGTTYINANLYRFIEAHYYADEKSDDLPKIRMVKEPDNPHDHNAIRVDAYVTLVKGKKKKTGWVKMGFIPRDYNTFIGEKMDAAKYGFFGKKIWVDPKETNSLDVPMMSFTVQMQWLKGA